MRKVKKLPEVLVYEGTLGYRTNFDAPEWLSITELKGDGKVIFQDLYSVGYVTDREETGSHFCRDNSMVFGIFHMRICRKSKKGDFAIILMVGEQSLSYRDLNERRAIKENLHPLSEEWNGINKDTKVYVSSVQSQKGTVDVIHCEIGTVEDCPEEIRSIYKEECLIGVSCVNETFFEKIIWNDSDDYIDARVVIFTYKNKTFAFFEVCRQQYRRKNILIGKIIKLEW